MLFNSPTVQDRKLNHLFLKTSISIARSRKQVLVFVSNCGRPAPHRVKNKTQINQFELLLRFRTLQDSKPEASGGHTNYNQSTLG